MKEAADLRTEADKKTTEAKALYRLAMKSNANQLKQDLQLKQKETESCVNRNKQLKVCFFFVQPKKS